MPIMTNKNFSRNAVSATYRVGFVIQSTKPLRNCSTSAAQMTGNSRLSEAKGIVSNIPSSRRQMMKMNPSTSAVPNSCSVSANGQPHNSPRTHTENSEFSNPASTAQSSPACCVCPSYPPPHAGEGGGVSPAASAYGFVELKYREEGNAEDAGIDPDDHQNNLKPVHRTPLPDQR